MSKRARSLLVLAVKLAVAAGLIWYLLASEKMKKVDWDGLAPALRRWEYLVGAFLLLGAIPWIGAARWYMLLRCQGFEVRFRRVFHLTLVGVFFNCIGVGYIGGDLAKAYYVARDQPRGRRAEAVYTVGFDRFVGFFGLLVLGAAAMLVRFDSIWYVPRLRIAALVMIGALVVVSAGFLLMFSKRFRESETIAPKLAKIPGGLLFLRFYRSVKIYRAKYKVLATAVGMSVVGHGVMIGVLWLLGKALNMEEISVAAFGFCVAAGIAISSIGPPMGLGFGQAAFAVLFEQHWPETGRTFGFFLATLQQVLMLAFNVALGLPAFLLVRREIAEIRAEMRADEAAGAEGEAPANAAPQADADA